MYSDEFLDQAIHYDLVSNTLYFNNNVLLLDCGDLIQLTADNKGISLTMEEALEII